MYIFKFAFSYLFKYHKLNKEVIIFNSTVNRYYNFNSKYLFEYFIENLSDKYQCKFIIDDPALFITLTEEMGDYFITSKKIKDIIYILKAKTWITSTIDVPIISLCKNKNRIVFHLGHGVPLKNIILAERKIPVLRKINRIIRTRIFTHVICYSDEFSGVMRNAFKNKNIRYIPLGQPRNDYIINNKNNLKKEIHNKIQRLPKYENTILYAPTWRSYHNIKFFPFDDLLPEELNSLLVKSKTILFLRNHPYYGYEIDSKYLEQSNIFWFNSDKFMDITRYLGYFDKLITDYSSIYLDYICLNRAIGFIPYDIEKYISKVGFSYDYNRLLCGDKILDKEDFFSFINQNIDQYKEERDYVSSLTNTKAAGNCYEIASFIESLLRNKEYDNSYISASS